MSSSIPPIIVVIVLLLVAIGPILTLFPSPRERQQSRLRQLAYREGYRVEFVPSSWAQTFRQPVLEQSGWILYWLPWPSTLSRGKQQQLTPLLHFRTDEVSVPNPLIEVFPVPEPFLAVFLDSTRVGLVWREQEGTAEKVAPALRAFRSTVENWCEG